ncbi:hypothetical protein CBR_g40856 [Chara braunii]|uniref:Adaptor protein ClpS core domain-containing protein n=1 Tax=Chara braunii TaxID=69332 RepID=A0A388K2A3_CHABU|nr:hypothetical protein CBR_g40856 [Chara braunii]|eukprot:GBG64157.1 hypothetical protein CBR_g40856 [Chara braunii]
MMASSSGWTVASSVGRPVVRSAGGGGAAGGGGGGTGAGVGACSPPVSGVVCPSLTVLGSGSASSPLAQQHRQLGSLLRESDRSDWGSLPVASKLTAAAVGRRTCIRSVTLPGRSSGGGVLDKPSPVIDKPTPGRESEFDLRKDTKKKMSPPYKVLLHNDNFNKREYVVQVLMKCIPGMTLEGAFSIMNEAHIYGLSCVIVCGQDEAEEHCQSLRNNGLISSIEPDIN